MKNVFVLSILILKVDAYFTCKEVKKSYKENECCGADGASTKRFDVKPYGRGQMREFRSMTTSGRPVFYLVHADNAARPTIIDFPGVGVELGQQSALYSVNNPNFNPYFNYVQMDGDITVREFHESLGIPEIYCNNFPVTPEGDYRCTQQKALSSNATRLHSDVLEVMDNLVSDGYSIENNFVFTGVSLGTIVALSSLIQSNEIMDRVKTIALISGLWGTTALPDISKVNILQGKHIYLTYNVNDDVVRPLVGAGSSYSFAETVASIAAALKCGANPAYSPVLMDSELYKITEHKYECADGVFEHLEFEIDETYPSIPLGFVSTYKIPITHFFTVPMSNETIPLDYWDGSQTIYSTPYFWPFLERNTPQ